MATSKQTKQPPFPHPPLEQGVAQYPTPLVPNYTDKKGGWNISDQGHIILVEKVSIEKGNFNPQPLDGSVIYTGRDANKWPSNLYLVAERPTPEGEYIYRYWANSRTYSSQNPWNYDIKYSSDDPNYPIYTRTYVIKREDYAAIPIGTKDPIFDGDSTLAAQEMSELPDDNPLHSLFVAHRVAYETIPGPQITTSQLDPLIGTYPVSTLDQVVLSGSTASIPAVGQVNEYEKIDAIKSKLSQRTYTSLINQTWTEYETITYTFPAYIIFNTSSPSSLSNITAYYQARSFRVIATVVYKVITESDFATISDGPVNFTPVTLTTDFGTFPNVIHNAASVLIGGSQVGVQKATVNVASPYLPFTANVSSGGGTYAPGETYRNYYVGGAGDYHLATLNNLQMPVSLSNTILKEMGGLRLLKITYVGSI